MKELVLYRFAYTHVGVFGSFDCNGSTLYTVEQVWVGNMRNMSCIPEGQYKCVPGYYYRGDYKCVEVTGVPNRSQIKWHRANLPSQLRGCIAPVQEFGCLEEQVGGRSSRRAFDMFMREYGAEEFLLTIKPLTELKPPMQRVTLPEPKPPVQKVPSRRRKKT